MTEGKTTQTSALGVEPTVSAGAAALAPLATFSGKTETVLLSFAGQGSAWIDVLARLAVPGTEEHRLVGMASEVLAEVAASPEALSIGAYPEGTDLASWLAPTDRPSAQTLAAGPISQPAIFLTQMLAWRELHRMGMAASISNGGVAGLTGHSQGLVAAAAIAVSENGLPSDKLICDVVRALAFQGILMDRAWLWNAPAVDTPDATPMAAVSGLREAELKALIAKVAPEGVDIGLRNTSTRFVLSAAPELLERVRMAAEMAEQKALAAKKAGKRGGRVPSVRWEYLDVSAPFHSQWMAPARLHLGEVMEREGIELPASAVIAPVWSCGHAAALELGELWARVWDSQFDLPVLWRQTLIAATEATGATRVLDVGPGQGVAVLAASALRGRGIAVHGMDSGELREQMSTPGADLPVRPAPWTSYAPSRIRLPNGDEVLSNAYTRATGHSPYILPGMTPTTADVPIVAAAANAGHTAELAGGGQVNEQIFWLRMEELAQALEPGRTVTFNAMFLDPYLWGLHLGKTKLVQQAVQAGYPISGVTITAGIPGTDEAVALLNEFAALGMHHNGFKPGTVAQVDKVLKIAKAAPEHTIFMHLEGGHAGGHHSWEDLNDLLLNSYASIRRQPNVVLCVGGGVGTPERAASLLTGSWSLAFGEPAMPVDAILLGTATMACLEACTSPSVKAALAGAQGTDAWVTTGMFAEGVTSGRSGLDADIYYLESTAARTGAMLDEVAGDEEAVASRKAEIIEAINGTCKPYFGELEEMTYAQVVGRMVELMAVGRNGRYEDGPWLDATWRGRVFDVMRRFEQRLRPETEGEFTPIVTELSDLDEPALLVERLLSVVPNADSTTLHPADVQWFLSSVVRRPGKPVPFVPVIDKDVRKWFKSDSLWQAHDDRFTADQVLTIPGPMAVKGIEMVDEPVADLMTRFESHALALVGGDAMEQRGRRDVSSDELPMVPGREILAALLSAPKVQVGELMRANPVAALVEEGTTWSVDAAGMLVSSKMGRGEMVRMQLMGEGKVQIRLTTPLVPSDLVLDVQMDATDLGRLPTMTQDAWNQALTDLYAEAAGSVEPAPLFGEVTVDVPELDVRPYATATGTRMSSGTPAGWAFSLAWDAVLGVLRAPELVGGLLDLVHLDNGITLKAWPPKAGEALQARARLVQREVAASGQTLTVTAELVQGENTVATLRQRFFVRESRPLAAGEMMRREAVTLSLTGMAQDDVAWLQEQSFVKGAFDGSMTAELVLHTDRTEAGFAHAATGTLMGAEVSFEATTDKAVHPLVDLLADWTVSEPEVKAESKLLGSATVRAPRLMDAFATAGRDGNAIHRSPAVARMAGFEAPIVHGMWTAAASVSQIIAHAAGGKAARVHDVHTEFLAPLALNESVDIEVRRVGLQHGDMVVEVMAYAGEARQAVMKGRARITPPKTAWVFPGQGIQDQGMGMAGYARSKAARQVWDKMDKFTREHLGFSILKIVRENPREVIVNGVRQVHPKGVLHLTHFTQVAMAVLAQAQVAELRERGVFFDEAVVAGHSVGEYNALGGLSGVLPPEVVVQTVYHRGMVMHTLVPRDETGESGYRMGVIRPHHAGMTDKDAEAMVQAVRAETGEFLQIVNYNVRGRQYSVTGTLKAIDALATALEARRIPGRKTPWVQVPGIDVPFHSEVLRGGVDDFRATLDSIFPKRMCPSILEGSYVPNLTACPFELSVEFCEKGYAVTECDRFRTIAKGIESGEDVQVLTRDLLIELLAWQFTSPVRWIETQELMFRPVSEGGLGVERIVEIGVGYQPTLNNMALSSLRAWPLAKVEVFNAEAKFDLLCGLDKDLAPVVKKAAPAAEAAAPAAEAAPAAAAPAAAAPVATASAAPDDQPLSTLVALKCLIALQSKVRLDQLSDGETIDEVFDGVSSRRNQVLLDMGTEFGVSGIDGAQDLPLADLAAEIDKRNSAYVAPGAYLTGSATSILGKALGRAGWDEGKLKAAAGKTYGFGPQLQDAAMVVFALNARDGESVRGGDLGLHADIADGGAAKSALGETTKSMGKLFGTTFGAMSTGGGAAGGVVSSEALDALTEQVMGESGLVGRLKSALDGMSETEFGSELPQDAVVSAFETEFGETVEKGIAARFDGNKHVAFGSSWAFRRSQVAQLFFGLREGTLDQAKADELAVHLSRSHGLPEVEKTARWYAERAQAEGHAELADLMTRIAEGIVAPATSMEHRPHLEVHADGSMTYSERATGRDLQARMGDWHERLEIVAGEDDLTARWLGDLAMHTHAPLDFAGKVALITGASPGSIALSSAANLLQGGATVILTTSNLNPARRDFYRTFHRTHAAPGAMLYVVPFNAASLQDVDALIDWVFDPMDELVGANPKRVKPPMTPDIILPFAALKDLGTLVDQGPWSEVALRGMLTSVERMVAHTARRLMSQGVPKNRCQIVLPLSPNHGGFGGDGCYGASKAALEVLLERWYAEQGAWGRAVGLVGAKIGWVRGTGLMAANNPIAARIEAKLGPVTFSTDEMGWLITSLCTDAMRKVACGDVIHADLTAGLSKLDDWGGMSRGLREELAAQTARLEHREKLQAKLAGASEAVETLKPLTDMPVADLQPEAAAGYAKQRPSDLIVIVGASELGPCGTSRTRWAIEHSDKLAPSAVLELAWMTGLIAFDEGRDGGAWVDVASGNVIAEEEIAERYEADVRGRVGLRWTDPEVAGFDPNAMMIHDEVFLEKDFTFTVRSEDEARGFLAQAPESTDVRKAGSAWQVTRKAGTTMRLPRHGELSRKVAGLLPSGIDLSRWGIPKDMMANVDPVSLMNLAATAEAFQNAGLSPEELMQHIHPARVSNTQGSGMGGMQSLERLFTRPMLNDERQSDQLQESLINVMSAYAVQSFVGSYGPMVHPVAACATAAVSMEEAYDKLMLGKTDFVLAGGFDDITTAGVVGFADMNATADTAAMAAKGLLPSQMSRPNDAGRRGFLEAEGGGSFLVTRGDVAARMGLPVLGVVGWAGSFADGVHTSIPAPGQGALAVAMGGMDSMLGKALSKHGLTADDVGVVYKHDTSTQANDPNETELHHRVAGALGRTEGNPLFVVSQKHLTGHPKGGAAAWQMVAAMQAMNSGVIPGNRNLDTVDGGHRRFGHMCYTDRALHTSKDALKAALVTSLGFGHVSALVLLIHRDAFLASLSEDELEAYLAAANARLDAGHRAALRMMMGQRQPYAKRSHRRFAKPDGSVCQKREEAAMLLNPNARLGTNGIFTDGSH